jgi:hypothetical protein
MEKTPLHQSISGDLWSKHSQGNCLFIMAVKKMIKGKFSSATTSSYRLNKRAFRSD